MKMTQETLDTLGDFSLSRMVRDAISNPADPPVPRSLKIKPNTPLTPHTRDLTTASDSGGAAIGTAVSSTWGEAIRTKSLLGRLGAMMLPVGDVMGGMPARVRVPRIPVGSTARWVAEGATDTESSPEIGGDLPAPMRVCAHVEASRTLLANSYAMDMLLRDLIASVAFAVDSAVLNGAGEDAYQPLGILNRSDDVEAVSLGTNGGVLEYATVVDTERELVLAGHEPASLAWITSPSVRAKLRTTPRIAGYPIYILDDMDNIGRSPLFPHAALPDDLTMGTGEGLGSAILGDWSQVVILNWTNAAEIIVNPYSRDVAGLVRLSAILHVNFALKSPGSFRRFVSVDTSTA